jgi:nucleotide-binding universal stress UspA family protein
VAQSESLAADLIVLGAQRHFMPWWLRGGVSEYVVRHATVPVLIVPFDYHHPLIKKENHVEFHSN